MRSHSSAQRRQAWAQSRQCWASCFSHSAAQARQASAHKPHILPCSGLSCAIRATQAVQVAAQSKQVLAQAAISGRHFRHSKTLRAAVFALLEALQTRFGAGLHFGQRHRVGHWFGLSRAAPRAAIS